MKLTMKLLVLFFGVLMLLGNVAYAQSPRDELKQMVEQLQASPNDNALREKIIALAATLKTAPVIPEEVERHMAYGAAAFTGAKSVEDYKEAAKEFDQATLAAPWYGDAYFNLGVTQDKAENYEAALRNLNFALLASPDNKEIKTLIYQVEYRNKKLKMIKEEAARIPDAGVIIRDCAECPEMVVIPTGSFNMGKTDSAHRVTITKVFALGKTEVTQGQWKAIMGNNPSKFINCGDSCPVERVSWNDTQAFIQKLNAKTGKQYRLPSDAEWEYACRAGRQQEYCGSDNVDSVAWHSGNSGSGTHPVAGKQANAFGLFDMSGNVSEWVEDCANGNCAYRVFRGGSWLDGYSVFLSVADSNGWGNTVHSGDSRYGFRLARMLP